jgi:hypothetical protein
MIKCIITGGQSGADQGAWQGAKAAGLATGGWMPRGWMTEEGPRPDFHVLYGAEEHNSPACPPRARENVAQADATLLFNFGAVWSAGTIIAYSAAEAARKPIVIAQVGAGIGYQIVALVLKDPEAAESSIHSARFKDPVEGVSGFAQAIAEFALVRKAHTLNVGGNRASRCPGIGGFVARFLGEIIKVSRELTLL